MTESAGPDSTIEPTASTSAAPIWRQVLWLTWPVLLQHFMVLTVGLSDQFLGGYFQQVPPDQQAEAVGHRLTALGMLSGQGGLASAVGAEASWEAGRQIMASQVSYQAAQTTASYLSWFLNSYMVLVSVGSTALVARFVGAGNWDQAIHVTNQSLFLAVVLGLTASVVGLAGLDSLLWLLQLRGNSAEFAALYLRPIFSLLVFQVIEFAGIACLVGAGDTRPALWVLGGVALVNLPLSWLLYHGGGPIPSLGFQGIALGTALSHMLGALAVLVMLARGRAGLRLNLYQFRPHRDLLRRLLRISIPAGIDSLSHAIYQLWFLSIINQLGDVASTAHGIALRWEGLGYLSGAAFGTAAMSLIGRNLGAGQPDRARRSGWVALAWGCGVMCLMGVVFYILAPAMFAMFCPRPEQWPVIETGVPVLRLVAFAMPPLASCIVLTYALRGAGDTRIPLLVTWIGFLLLRIPLAYLLTRDYLDLGILGIWPAWNFGLLGAWLAMFVDLLVRGLLILWRFANGAWQSIRV